MKISEFRHPYILVSRTKFHQLFEYADAMKAEKDCIYFNEMFTA